MTRAALSIDRRIELFHRQGWYPVRWSHHPAPIKELIRKGRFVPKMKACYENSLRLIMAAIETEHEQSLRYCEGWATSVIPIEHSWLVFDGAIVDLTLGSLDDEHPPTYGEHRSFTCAEALALVVRVGTFGPLTNLWEIGPYTQAIRNAGLLNNGDSQ